MAANIDATTIAQAIADNLAEEGPGTLHDLATALGLSQRQVSGVVLAQCQRFEAVGWVRKRNNGVVKLWRIRRVPGRN